MVKDLCVIPHETRSLVIRPKLLEFLENMRFWDDEIVRFTFQ